MSREEKLWIIIPGLVLFAIVCWILIQHYGAHNGPLSVPEMIFLGFLLSIAIGLFAGAARGVAIPLMAIRAYREWKSPSSGGTP